MSFESKNIFEQQFFPDVSMESQAPFVDPLSPWDNRASSLEDMFDEALGFISTSSSNEDVDLVEPTPIGSNNIDVVEKIPFTAAPWLLQVGSLETILNPLLRESSTQKVALPPQSAGSASVTLGSYCSEEEGSASSVASSSMKCSDDSNFKASQLVQWNARYEELVAFRNKYGHCLVPLTYPENPGLAHWIKRQRYQYSLKQEGKHSTLSMERENSLEQLGFIWDSHAAQWEERLQELEDFRDMHGHCYVPTKYPVNPKLSIWVKCQRRQFKLYQAGNKKSNITAERIAQLLRLGFAFNPRMGKRSSSMKLPQNSFDDISCL